jgi:diguanylate cyclase (GGDEF)-like protein
MNASTRTPPNVSVNNEYQKLNQVILELNHSQQHLRRVNLMNKLHVKMADTLGLDSIIEAYSVWLMPHIAHVLIGYSNTTRKKKYLFCTEHGPNRRRAIVYAERLIDNGICSGEVSSDCDGHFVHKWVFEDSDDLGVLLILKNGKTLDVGEEKIFLINNSLEIFSESLKRGLEYEDLLEHANHDVLTGLPNRRIFNQRIKAMMESSRRYNHPLTILSMDLDHFKDINDTHGHLAEDEVLKSVANVLNTAVRSTDMVVRMGGDEFLLVLENTDRRGAQVLADRLCSAIDGLDVWANKNVKLGVSVGLAQLTKTETLNQWLERVDEILYQAKANGRFWVAVK